MYVRTLTQPNYVIYIVNPQYPALIDFYNLFDLYTLVLDTMLPIEEAATIPTLHYQHWLQNRKQ